MARKITNKENQKRLVDGYNMQYNEIFKLHKFLVERTDSNHCISNGNPIDDAIALINKLSGEI